MTHLMFAYGTLHLPQVQVAVFGSVLPGRVDAVVGYVLGEVVIDDPDVVAASGADMHPMLLASDDLDAVVEGYVLELDDAQLAAADAYEVDAYVRVSVTLRSGRTAWVYTLAP
jgi:gamma-glutamylcyclotransferase (GGCT)/AIG2-like uncharacterized protein YtfP